MVWPAKFGKGGELARSVAASRKHMPAGRQEGMRLLTDLRGPCDTVVIARVLAGLSAWEQGRKALLADPGFQASAAASQDLIASGQQEFYTIKMPAPQDQQVHSESE
jgi:hypothetical protein